MQQQSKIPSTRLSDWWREAELVVNYYTSYVEDDSNLREYVLLRSFATDSILL